MSRDDHDIHMGKTEAPLRQMRQNQRDNAHIHLAHDYGFDAVRFLFQHYSSHELLKGITVQRAQMTIDGTLYDANDKLVGKVNLAELGVSKEHIAEAEKLRDAEAVRGPHAARFAPPAHSHVAGADEDVRDFPGAGRSAAR